ncbi:MULTISPECIES: hypothetical protein [unclassified Saccharopolyspora]|uniref:hypothetical protein n=1 Tax=unclassified Saccharopolyspora TaxID=2646250 RepID=UPI001CD59F9C|nr:MULTISPECIES: hypothetical protein [unclassified Saccharopolyspora]MCA1190076.1 hypothetical protein [Saccharopolyspora sp. 6T]MCA1193239.1 hypothetical protein [Saccharopolyspora sp. 6V]MCA1279656.1 hypothetical protein [Saccharopolyspora sp. 7B]
MALPHPYRCSRPVAFWIVGLALHLRHATPSRPGALPGGERTATLCGDRIRVPFDTPPPRRPRSADITALPAVRRVRRGARLPPAHLGLLSP